MEIPSSKKYRGVLSLYNDAKQFGMIACLEKLPFDAKTIFAHRTNFVVGTRTDQLVPGVICEFEIGVPYKIGRNPQAVRVRVLNIQDVGAAELRQAAGKASLDLTCIFADLGRDPWQAKIGVRCLFGRAVDRAERRQPGQVRCRSGAANERGAPIFWSREVQRNHDAVVQPHTS